MQKEMQKFGYARKHKERMKNMDTVNECGHCTLCKATFPSYVYRFVSAHYYNTPCRFSGKDQEHCVKPC